MPAIQLNLFGEVFDTDINDEVFEDGDNSEASNVEMIVSAYRILDRLTNSSYIGISIDPATRFATHRKGKTSNKKLNRLMMNRPNDVNYEIIDEFIDPHYRSNSSESRAVQIEAFLIQFYDAIENGMNTAIMFYHDYKDVTFWKKVLTPKLFDIYSVANHDLLNERSRRNLCLKPTSRKNNNVSNKEFKIWATNYLLELEEKEIKIFVLAQELENLDRCNLFRFIRQQDFGAVSARRLNAFIKKLENHLGIPHRELPFVF